jgi:two-component system response regulator AtoC
MNQRTILVVDDEPHMRRVLEIMLRDGGHAVLAAGNGREALTLMGAHPVDLVITDLRMPEMDGIALLSSLREQGSEVPVIVITAHGTVESAVAAMRIGACDYLLRPFDIDALELAVARALKEAELTRQNTFLRAELDRGYDAFVGASAAMEAVYALIRQVAPTKASVMLAGETGTGKELAARAIHNNSPRSAKLFVPINCAAIPADILEAELFGYERGAFTGAHKERVGKFELADGGTVFLDELTEMPIALQSKLLRFLQDSTLERLGGNRRTQLDVRFVAATNRDPREAVRAGLLREDLFYRLNVFPIQLPPLRERTEDIAELVRHFIVKHGGRAMQQVPLDESLIAPLRAYAWPGNVRELENVVERAIVLCGGGALTAAHFPLRAAVRANPAIADEGAPAPGVALVPAVEAFEAQMIARALEAAQGSKPRAAALLDISERSLWYKIKRYFPKEG